MKTVFKVKGSMYPKFMERTEAMRVAYERSKTSFVAIELYSLLKANQKIIGR